MQLGKLDVSQSPQHVGCKTAHNGNQPDQRVRLGSQNQPPLRSLASAAATAIYDAINVAHSSDDLDRLAGVMWRGYGEGAISEDDATFLDSFITRRRPLGPRTAPGYTTPLGKLAGRLYSRFTPRQRQRSPDRKASRDRRRMLGGSSALPDSHRHHYTEGQRAFLCIVAGEVKRHGICDFPIDKIAALAGVCRTTAQTTMHEARRLGHLKITERPQRGRKSLTNVMEIISPEWRAWMRRAPSAAHLIGSNLVKMVSPTKNTDLRKKGAIGEEDQVIDHGLPRRAPEWGSTRALA